MKVLLVEDNQGDARLIREMLGEGEAEQFDLSHVESLAAASKCLNETSVDVVLLDLSLPDSHGLDTFVRIHTQVPAVPIVVLSGFGDETFAVEAVRQGAQDYLTKGKFDGNQLVRSMRYAIERQRIENALKQSEEKLHTTFESITDAIVITDTLGSIVQTNEAATRMTGYSREEIIGKSGLDLIDPKYHDMAVQTMMKVLEEGHGMESMELQFLTKDGKRVDAEFGTAMIRDTSGKPAGFVSIARDITERKRVEEKVKVFSKAIDSAFDSFVLVDMNGNVTYANESAIKTFGYLFEEMMKLNIAQFAANPEDAAKVIKEMIAKGVWSGELSSIRKNKETFPVILSTSFLIDDQGHPVGMMGIFRDITERKRAETALLVKDWAVEAAINAIAISDLAGNLNYVNTAFIKLWGYSSPAEVLGKSATGFWQMGEKAAEVMEALRTSRGWFGELVAQRKDGTFFDVEVAASLVVNPAGQPICMQASFADITERKRAEEKLRFFALAVESSSDAIGMSTPDGKHYYQNKAFDDLFGDIGDNPPATVFVDEQVGREVFRTIMGGNPWTGEIKMRGKAGELLDVFERAYAIKDDTERILGLVGIHTDITERKRMEGALRASEGKLRAMFKSTSDGIVVTDLRFNILQANEAAARILGHKSKESLIGTSALGLISAEKVVDANGKQIFIEFSFSQIRDAAGNLTGNICVVRDVSERRRAVEAIRQRNRELAILNTVGQALNSTRELDNLLKISLETVMEAMDFPIGVMYLLDEGSRELVLSAHKGVTREMLKHISRFQLEGSVMGKAMQKWKVLVMSNVPEDERREDDGKPVVESTAIQSAIFVPISAKGKTLGMMTLGGHVQKEVESFDNRLLEAVGSQIGAAIENAQLLEKLEEISITDKLTGLYNRRHFYEVLESEVNRTQRYGHPFSLVMLDLDGFKAYNDKFGHMTGDEILKDFAATLKATLRKSDRAFRYGGDEFAIVLPSTDAAKADKLVDRFRTKWPQTVDGEFEILETPLGFSAGIAQFPEDIDTLDGLITMADAALYKAKREGKYRTELASAMESALNH